MQWPSIVSQAAPVTDPTSGYVGPLISLGGFGLLLVLLLLGRVVTKATLDEMRTEKEAWRTAAELANQTVVSLQESLRQFADQGEISNKLLTEIKANTKKAR
jgi:hypothetical protein